MFRNLAWQPSDGLPQPIGLGWLDPGLPFWQKSRPKRPPLLYLLRRCKKQKALGFDCEWVTEKSKRQPVALIQLSSFDGYCALIRLSEIKAMPACLKDLLEDETIYKVGVAPKDDGKYLLIDYSVVIKSTLDLRHLADQAGVEAGGLASLASKTLGVALDKSWRIRCSNWEAQELTQKQQKYAALDAHVAIRIFAILMEKIGRKRSVFSWLYSTKDSVWSQLDKYCSLYADASYKNRRSGTKSLKVKEKEAKTNKEALLQSKRYPYATMGKPLYNNCYLEAPDGELLCTCDKKKALWYVERTTADIVKEDPLTVRLRFEPSGRSVGAVGRYYQLKKENKCVVCGDTQTFIRKNVVPREYRKLFPDIMKDHSSHDVVLLCVHCHQLSNIRDQAVRERLAALCHAPLGTAQRGKFTEDSVGKRIKSAARALLYQSRRNVLPEARRKELEEFLLQHYPDQVEVTEELLQDAANIQTIVENTQFESHGEKVVDYFLKGDGLLRLEEIWREHFLKSMEPRHMPELWSVKHNEERLRVKWDEGRLSQEHLKSIGLTRL
ncbi:exonuclease 3'-5' domain-containing protein 2 [Trichoplusia ni]|uniref:Exonuclease 3'-5' domain-containing protein 2 n=1 Tax=Trichoplusia ni TaxID=7111 RepID=A0A7E5VEA2_TRINI|nr:exonuclease 3'-5' domain-containing protein 2 [Trichoplusia ni]